MTIVLLLPELEKCLLPSKSFFVYIKQKITKPKYLGYFRPKLFFCNFFVTSKKAPMDKNNWFGACTLNFMTSSRSDPTSC